MNAHENDVTTNVSQATDTTSDIHESTPATDAPPPPPPADDAAKTIKTKKKKKRGRPSYTGIARRLALGRVTIERLAAVPVPRELKPTVESFKKAYANFATAHGDFFEARAGRSAARARTFEARDAVGAALEGVAAAIIHADPSTRSSPFASYGRFTATNVMTGTGARVAEKARELGAAILATKPRKPLRVATEALLARADALERAQARLTPHEVVYDESLTLRDEAMLEFIRAFSLLKRGGEYAWHATPERIEAVFAPVARDRVATTKKRAKQPTA